MDIRKKVAGLQSADKATAQGTEYILIGAAAAAFDRGLQRLRPTPPALGKRCEMTADGEHQALVLPGAREGDDVSGMRAGNAHWLISAIGKQAGKLPPQA